MITIRTKERSTTFLPVFIRAQPRKTDLFKLHFSVDMLICSRTDYAPHSSQAMFAAIKSGKFEFISPFWDDVDAGAKDMINCLLVLDTEKRYSAEQVTAKRLVWCV